MLDFLYAGRVEPLLYVAWLASVGGAAFAAVRAIRRALVAKTAVPWTALIALVTPSAALALTTLAFTIGHGHPLAQYNDGDSWPWVRWWWAAFVPLLLGSAAGTLASLLLALRAIVKPANGPSRLGAPSVWGAACFANAVSLVCVLRNIPDA